MEDISLVSVILPTYNRAKLLPRAISSVLDQTYPYWELIIWDDGSTDNTGEIVRSYHDSRIRYFSGANHGAAYARNRASEVSQGIYMAFLDSDDEWINDKLAIQVDMLNAHINIDVLFGDFIDIQETTREKYRTFEQFANVMKLLDVDWVDDSLFIIKGGLLESITIEDFIATDSVIIRRELLEKIGFFNETLRNLEDFELWWRMGLAGFHFAYINKVCLTRYKPMGSLSSPSILSCENVKKGLDFCLQDALSKGRKDLVPNLKNLYRNAWQNLILLYGSSGNGKEMLNAFFQATKYGFNLGSIRLLLEAILDYKYVGKKRVGIIDL